MSALRILFWLRVADLANKALRLASVRIYQEAMKNQPVHFVAPTQWHQPRQARPD